MAHVNSLLEALVIILYDMSNACVHHGHACDETFGHDVEDDGHGTLDPAQPHHQPPPQSTQRQPLTQLPRS